MKKRKKDEISHYIPGLSVGGRPLCDRCLSAEQTGLRLAPGQKLQQTHSVVEKLIPTAGLTIYNLH